MPVLNGKELRIVGFLCNWCSYGGADTAGVARATQPTDLRIIRVPSSASTRIQRSSTTVNKFTIRGFGSGLQSRSSSARYHSTSELLRTL